VMKLLVKKQDGALTATVIPRGKTSYDIQTEDEDVRQIIQQVLDKARDDGLAYHFYRRHKTDTGIRYERLGRWLKPGEGEFLQALADYLINYELFAYPEYPEGSPLHSN